jgi:hypothetical protein
MRAMSRLVALATVGDLGAAEVIVEALTSQGIQSQVSRVLADHPYQRSPLEPVRVLVPEELFAEANGVLAALQLEVERDFPAEGGAGAIAGSGDLAPELERRASRRVSYATLWLAFAVPLPITCLCVGARLAGTLFLGVFIGDLVTLVTFERGTAPMALLWWLLGVKVGDLAVALAVSVRRGRAVSRSTNVAG